MPLLVALLLLFTSSASAEVEMPPNVTPIGIDAVSGVVVERLPVYGGPSKISVVGEPRAARVSLRRRGARH